MKHRVINRDKIVNAWVEEPEDGKDFMTYEHGWQVCMTTVIESTITLNMESESECINFINSLNFVKI